MRDRFARLVLLAAAGLLVSSATAVAGSDNEQVRLTPAGQAAARAASLRRSDMGTAAPWTGGQKKPDAHDSKAWDAACPDFHPKESDLVVNGRAAASFTAPGVSFESATSVFRSARMVLHDWQRSVPSPRFLACTRRLFANEVRAEARASHSPIRLISLKRFGFPHVTQMTEAWRALIDYDTAKGRVRMMIDLVFLARGRTEITLTTTAPSAAAGTITPAEGRLAAILESRMPR